MARGRGGAGGGGGGAAAATDANAAAATAATALSVPASVLQLFYDLASVDEVSDGCLKALAIAIDGSDGSISRAGQERERGHSFRS